jgi:hypothetical protein
MRVHCFLMADEAGVDEAGRLSFAGQQERFVIERDQLPSVPVQWPDTFLVTVLEYLPPKNR